MKMKYNPEEEYFPITYENFDLNRAKANIIYAVLALIGLVTAAVFMILEFDKRITGTAVGFGFMMLGIFTIKITVSDYPEERLESTGLFILGALTLLVSLFTLIVDKLNIFPGEEYELFKDKLISFAFLTGGAYGLIYEKIVAYLKKNRCTECVAATCIDTVATGAKTKDTMYIHVWEYTTNGFTYTNPENRRYFAKKNRIGDIRDIYVNPDDPEDIYVNRFHRRNIVYVLFVIVGVILTARFFVGI
ncbi:DUF3592 domain-containing protein [Ruminococcus sp. HUN007]|uniref:DUF3592 domain-containing protein n=1 Tax=Ruminococcus sp. HUN007 TaxID=1514668 RepID=UPI0005D1FF49|nr:DUF3592 domain-containing protein [Ruminococcus sp. HUN007]